MSGEVAEERHKKCMTMREEMTASHSSIYDYLAFERRGKLRTRLRTLPSWNQGGLEFPVTFIYSNSVGTLLEREARDS